MTKDDVKWIEVDNPEEWYCDICRKCADPICCDMPVEWLKHPNTKTEPHFRGVGDWDEGRPMKAMQSPKVATTAPTTSARQCT